MTPEEIKQELLDSKRRFEGTIPRMLKDYDDKVELTNKLSDILEYIKNKIPNTQVKMDWEQDPESYWASTIWFRVNFGSYEEAKKYSFYKIMEEVGEVFSIDHRHLGILYF